MARAELTEGVFLPTARMMIGVNGASVTVNERGAGAATVYEAATGVGTRTQPLTTAHGRIEPEGVSGGECWLEPGSYDILVTYSGQSWTQRAEVYSGVDSGTLASVESDIAVLETAAGIIVGAPSGTPATDRAALQAAIDEAQASSTVRTIILPGLYEIDATPLALNGTDGLAFRGLGQDTCGIKTAAGDMFTMGTAAAALSRVTFEDLTLWSAAGGGHIFVNGGKGTDRCVWRSCRLLQDNAAKSIVRSVNQGWFVDNTFEPSCEMQHVAGSTAHAIDLVSANGDLNDNNFYAKRYTHCSVHFIRMENTGASSYCYRNSFRDGTGEILRGGFLLALSHFGLVVENVSNWDMAALGASLADWLVVGKSTTGPASTEIQIDCPVRAAGALGGGFYDVKLRSGECLREVYLKGGGSATLIGYKIDCGSNHGVDLRVLNGHTIDNMSSTTSGMLLGRGWDANQRPQLIVGGTRTIKQPTVPSLGTWAVGDRCVNSAPAVGSPKAWACTVAGTPGTWVSEGNL